MLTMATILAVRNVLGIGRWWSREDLGLQCARGVERRYLRSRSNLIRLRPDVVTVALKIAVSLHRRGCVRVRVVGHKVLRLLLIYRQRGHDELGCHDEGREMSRIRPCVWTDEVRSRKSEGDRSATKSSIEGEREATSVLGVLSYFSWRSTMLMFRTVRI